MTETLPIVSNNPAIQSRYEELRASGQSHSIADLLANRRFAAVRTDATFMRSAYGGQLEDDAYGRECRRRAIAAGVNPHGKKYLNALAQEPFDPRAWVDGKSDVLRVAREYNMTVTDPASGRVLHQGHQVEVPDEGPYTVAPDIVDNAMAQLEATSPEPIREKDRGEIRHNLTEKLSGR